MAHVSADVVRETTTTTGTGTVNLTGAISGFQGFVAAIGNGNTCFYRIESVSFGGTEWEVGIGTVTDATPDTLSRDTVLASSNSGSLVNFSAGTKNVFVTIPATQFVRPSSGLFPGRLSVQSGSFIPSADISNSANLYYALGVGEFISLPTSGVWRNYEISELSFAASGTDIASAALAVDTNYAVYIRSNAGTVELGLEAWTNDTTRATALSLTDGVYRRTGDLNRVWIGDVRTVSDGGNPKFEDSITKRFIYNHFHRFPRTVAKINTSSHTYATASWREWNNSTDSRFQWIDGMARQHYFVYRANIGGSGSGFGVGFAINATGGPAGSKGEQFNNLADAASSDSFDGRAGLNFLTGVEFGSGSSPTFERISTGGTILM